MKPAIFIVMLLVLASSVSAYWCYQETATAATECGGMGGGTYNYTSGTGKGALYDGDWTTSASLYQYFYINYTKPTSALNSSLWMISYSTSTQNITIKDDCFNNMTDKLSLLIAQDGTLNCWNGTGWYYFKKVVPMGGTFEEAMWWDMNLIESLNVELYDEQTGLQLNKSWSLEVWGDTFSSNFTSDDFNMSLDTISLPENFNFRYWLIDYTTRNYYKINAYNTTTKLYALNSSESLLTLYTITDQAASPLAGYTLAVFRKMMPSNAWEIVEMSVSDQNGQGTLTLEPYNVQYMFYVYDKNNQVVFVSSTPSVIPQNTIYIKVNTLEGGIDTYYSLQKVITSLVWSNATKNWTFTWADPQQAVRVGWLEVKKSNPLSSSVVCNVSTSSYLGTVTCGIGSYENDTTSTFVARGWLIMNSTEYNSNIDSRSYPSDLSNSLGIFGAFLALMIIITMAMFGIWNPAATIVFGCVGLIISKMFELIPLGWTYVVGIAALGLISAYMVKT